MVNSDIIILRQETAKERDKMDKLFKLYNSIALKKGFRLEVYHSETMNWCVTIHSNSGEK